MSSPIPVADIRNLRSGLKKLFTSGDLDEAQVVYPPWPAPRQEDTGEWSVPAALAVDFGTSAIAAAVVARDLPEVLILGPEREPLRPSHFGRREGLRSSSLEGNYRLEMVIEEDPGARERWNYFPCLKRRIELLARKNVQGWEQEALLDVAAVAAQALRAARDTKGQTLRQRLRDGFEIYLAVPNNFPPQGVNVLQRGVFFGAAAATGRRPSPRVTTVLEAEAVAYAEFGRRRLSPEPVLSGSALILDAGAGTTDATVVRIEGEGLRVVAHAGIPVGGIDLDALIAEQGGSGLGQRQRGRLERLRAAPGYKLRFWSATAAPPGDGDRHQALANALVAERGYSDRSPDGHPLAEALKAGYNRYLGLAVHGLLDSLHPAVLADVTRVVVSGRASLLAGFHEAVVAALKGRIDKGAQIGPPRPLGSHGADPRKLAVVEGVATFAARDFVTYRRPLQAGAEIYVEAPWLDPPDRVLLESGHPLVDGWGVVAFHNPQNDTRRRTVRKRTLSYDVLQSLVQREFFDGARDVDLLLAWSSMPLLRIPTAPPYTAWIAYNFFLQTAIGEVSGERFDAHSIAPEPDGAGDWIHPVHRLQENWFEEWFIMRKSA